MPEEPKLGDWRAFQASLQADTNNTFLNQFRDSSFRTFSGIDPAPEAKYDQGYYPGMDINQLRINNQSGWDVFENAVQNGLSAIPLEMAESVSNLIAQSWDNNKNEFLEGQNAFGNTMRELKEGIQKSNPIYATDAEKESFNPFSGIDWALNAPSVASTFSLLIPGWGLGRLAGGSVGALTRMAGASAKTMDTASTIAKIGTAAASSRYMENMLEGYGTFQESIGARLLEKGVNPKLIKDTTDLLLANPERALQGSYKDAFKEAADDAAKTVQWNWGAALQDVFQYAMIFGKVKIPSVAPKTALPPNSSFLKRSGRFGLKAIDQTRNLLITAASEGIEEGYQYVVGQEALHEGEMFGEGFEQRLSKYLVEEEMKTSMLLGAIMGGGFHAVGNVFEGVMKNYAKNMANTTAAEKAGNIAYQTASQHNQFAYAVKAAYAKNGNLQGVINNVQKIEEGLSKEEKKDNPESVIPLLQTLEEEGNRLKLKGYSAEQIADKISFDFHAALKKSSRIKSINAVKEFANKAITKDSIVEEQVPRFERRAKIDALEKLLKNNTQKLRAQFSSTLNNKLDEYAKELETLKAEDKEDTSPKLRENDYRDIASSEYFSYYLSGLDQAVSRERARRVLKQDPELEKEQKEFQEKAKKQAAKDVAEKIKQAKTPEEVERIKQEEAAITGNTSESDKILNDESENYQTSWDTLLSKTSKEVTFAQALLDTYRDTPLLFLADRAALSKILNRTLPSEASEFVKEIWLTLSTESEQSSAIRVYFQQKDKVGKTDPNGPKDSTSNSPEEDPENPSETIDNAPKYNQIEVVGAQFKWDPETKQVVYDLEGHLIPATNRYSDDPILNYSLLNDVSFAPHAHKDKEGNFVPGWKALLKINPNRTVNKEHTSHQDIAIEIYAVDPKTGKEIFIGHIHRSDRPNAKEPVDNFRKLIYDAYLKEKPTDIYTVPFEAEVEDKMPGHTYNLKIPRDAEHKKVRPKMGSLQAVLKGEPLYLLTTQVKDDAPPMWLGDQNLDKDHPLRDRIAELDIYKHATKGKSTDKRSQLTGGFMFMFLKGLNGKYVTTQIFTKYLHQLPKFQEQVNTLVDQLYETTNKDELEKIVNRIRAIVHVNHLSSNRAIIFKPGEEGKLQPYVVHGVINKANNAPLSEREGAFMSKDALKKTLSETIFYIEGNNINGNYVDESGKLVSFNNMIAERMETDINPDMPLQTTSFTITAKVIPTGVNLDAEPISTTNEGDTVVSTFSITDEVKEELFEKADIERRRQGLNGIEEIVFSNPNFRLEGFEIDGNYWNVVTSTDRAKVLVNINGVIVPFYLTTGQAGKGLVPGWYPFFGIGKDGWLNKTDKSDMETYYERYWGKETADIVKSISEELNGFYGTDPSAFKNDRDPNATSRPLTTLADKVEDYINSKLNYTPAINNADARKTLRSNVEQLGKEINAKYDAELKTLEKQPDTSNQTEIEGQVGTSNYSIINGLIFYNNSNGTIIPVVNPNTNNTTKEHLLKVIESDIERRKQEELDLVDIAKGGRLPIEGYEEYYKKVNDKYDAELAALEAKKPQEKEDYSVWNDTTDVDVNPISKGLNIKKAADDHANDQVKPSTISLTEPTVENVQQEIEYVKRILGSSAVVKAFSKEDQLPNTDTVAELLTNVRRNGQMLEGLFTNAAIYLRNSGTIGRGYHEAFHAIWTLALSEVERAKLSNEVRQIVGNSTLSDLEVEEYLAEKFRVQALIPKDNSLSSRLKEVLQGLWSLVKEFFNPHSSINVNRLFKDINQGLYRDKVTFSRNVEQFAKAMATSNKPSNFQLLEFKDVFHDQYHKLIEYLSNHPELKADNIKRSDAELIEIMAASEKMSSLQWLRDRMLYQVLNEINRLEKIGYDTTLWKQARNVYFGGSNHVKKISNSQYTIVKSTPLQTEALYSLNQYGLNLNFSTGELLAIEDVIEDYDDFTSQIFSEESHELPNFLRDRAIENNRLKLRDSIRRSLGNLTKYSLDGLKVSYNSYGVPQREDPKRILSILESQLTNSIDVADMLQRLRKLTNQHNWATELYERAKSDVSFKQDLWLGIGGMASYDYFGVSNRDRVFISNRKTVKFIIRDQLASAFLNRSNPIFNEDGSINIDKAQAHLTRLTAVEAEFAELPSHNVPQERLEELLQTLAKAFRDSYIDIDYETLSQLYSQKGITAFRNTVFTNPGAPITILKEAVTGNNVFTDFDQGSNKDYLSKLGDILRDVWSEQTQQVFMNMKNQRNYSVTEPSYLSTKIAQLKAGSTTFFNDFFTGTLSQAPIFSQLQQANFRDTLKIQILDGADYGEKKSYKELTKEELQRVFIDASLNGGSDKKTTLVPIPIPADSSMLPFIRFQKLNRIEALDNLYQLAIMEQKRINNFKANPDLDNVKNYGKRAGTFVYLTFLNDAGITDVVKQHKKVNELIANHFDELVNETFKEFKVTYAERHTNYTQAEVQSFIYNHVYYSSQIIAMFSKDPSFYKSVGDAFKRYKQLGAPGITGSEFANTKLKSLIVADEEILVDKDFLKILQDLAYKDVATQDKLAQADNTSDGFTFVSEDFYRKFCKAVGKWSVDQELTYQQIQAGKKSIPSHKLRDLYPPIKPYYFSDYDYAGERIPFQMKNSIHVLTDDMIAKYPNSEALVAVKEFLKGDLDMVSFDSTIKVGGFKIYEEVEGVEGPKNKTLKNISDSNWQNAIIEMNLSDLRWQQDNPPHWFEYHIRFGSQLRALITSGLKLTEDYQVGNTTMTGLEVRNLYFDLLETELQEAKENFEEGFNDSERPYEKLLDRIITMARDRNLPNSSIAALNNMTIDREGREIPDLASSATNELSQSILSSLYKRKVWTQEMPGGQFVNVSSFGVSNQLKYDVTPEGVINMEVLLPAWTKELIKVDIKDIKDSEVLNLLGYRIPTEGKYSMFNMKVVGFLPQESGGSIIMPKEVTKIAGLDFDIDKLFVFTPNHERVEGTIKAIKFDYTKNNENDSFNLNQPKAARQNAIIQIIRGILQSKYHAAELLGGGSFARLESISHAHYLKNEFPNLSYEKLISMKDKATEVAKMESKLYNAIYPATQVEFHERGATGESLIGLTANHRTHAAKSELTRLRLIEDITINGITTGTLNLFEGANGLIGKNLEQFTSAMVDNGKNPIAPFINFNSHTAHTAMLLIRLGYSIEFTTAFINNKVVRDLVKTANTDRVSLGSAIYDELRAQDLKPLTQLNVDLSEEDLFRDTASPFVVLQTLEFLYVRASELGRLVTSTKTDAKAAEGNVARLEMQLNAINTAKENKYTYLLNAADFFNPEYSRLTNMFYEAGYAPVVKNHKVFFPELQTSFKRVKDEIESFLPTGVYLNEAKIASINTQLQNFWMANHPIINSLEGAKQEFVQDVFNRLVEAKRNSNSKYLPFLGKLDTKSLRSSKHLVLDRIELYRTNLDETSIDFYRNLWWDMWQNGTAEESKLAKDLFKYSLITSGESNTYSTFKNLAHPIMYLEGDTRSLATHKSKLIQQDIYFNTSTFYDQYARNTHQEPISAITTISSKNLIIRNDRQALQLDTSHPRHLDKNKQPVLYVRVYNSEKYTYELYKDSGEIWGTGTKYVRVNPLGVPNYSYEYSPLNKYIESEFQKAVTLKNEKRGTVDNTPTPGDLEKKYNPKEETSSNEISDTESISLRNGTLITKAELRAMKSEDLHALLENAGYTPLEIGELLRRIC